LDRFLGFIALVALWNFAIGYPEEQVAPQNSKSYFNSIPDKANAGDPFAKHLVGDAYKLGDGVPPGFTEAATRYHWAATQGISESEFNFAYAHASGEGVNHKAALQWYTLAADKVLVQAHTNLASMYLDGREVKADHNSALIA
jgi:uncharacterized protein